MPTSAWYQYTIGASCTVLGNALYITQHHHHYHYGCEHGRVGWPLLNVRVGHSVLHCPLAKDSAPTSHQHVGAQDSAPDPSASGEGTLQ